MIYTKHPYTHSPYVARYTPSYHFFICDHQGNIRLVVDGSDNIKQTNEYFPYGGPWEGSNDQGQTVGDNRPDIQYDKNGKHYNVEFDSNQSSSRKHRKRINDNDPDAQNFFYIIK